MRRWTDGKSWSASRVSGSFLTYREMEGKRGGGFNNTRRSNGRTPDSGRLSDEDQDAEPEGYRYKADGLMKQSFSITTSQGQHLHLISYYSRPHPGAPDLPQPTTDPSLRHIVPAKGMYPESSLHEANPPAMTRAPMAPYTAHAGPPEQPPYSYTWGAPSWVGPWPPSPNEPPHWAHGKLTPEMKPQPTPPQPRQQHPVQRPPQHPLVAPQLPVPPTSAPSSQPPIYPKGPSPYEPERLPPPSTVHYPTPVRAPSLSPRAQQLQLQAAQAVMIDPHLTATSARNPQGPLPAMPTAAPRLTPPRTHSASPPRIKETDGTNGVNKASLSALLHPTPASSEPSSAHPANNNSASSSPRTITATSTGPPAGHDMYREDAKALRSLDRKFGI
jgi:hypothetical protein